LGITLNSFADDSTGEICFDVKTSKELLIEINEAQNFKSELSDLQLEFDHERQIFNSLVQDSIQKNDLLVDQVQDEHDRAESYRTEWKECSETLTKCQQSRPSRKIWYGAGLGSGFLIMLLIVAL